ncbi:type II secretion system GspH family protein [Patescibacteria group bacterium]|nr:type II secretion system GspH family protein [Patescibacteria group bacterium]MBU2158572.1 type II secretion system GspH family protein [Patescibacteria group bacterium]MBU2220702.1 type II secretion system GspH family protein [Patescibacteria group bacterium]
MESSISHILKKLSRGFTLVEMLVVLAIIVIVTGIAINGQSSFNKTVILTDTAYTLAFSIREAQSLGLSSRYFGGFQNAGYGVHFSSGSLTSYILFADTNPGIPGSSQGGICPGHTVASGPEARPGNCTYELPSEGVRTSTFNRGFKISKFCGFDRALNSTRCSDTNLDSLNIVYLRPNTQSIITGKRSGAPMSLENATIYVASPDGGTERCVSVSKVGQVSVGVCP